MTPPPKDCPGICANLPETLGEIRADMREMKVEDREFRIRVEEHLNRISALCPQHETRIRACEDDVLRVRTLVGVIPWTGKILYTLVGFAFTAGAYIVIRILPALISQAQSLGTKLPISQP